MKAAKMLGVDPRTIRKWSEGEREISDLVGRFVTLVHDRLAEHKRLREHRFGLIAVFEGGSGRRVPKPTAALRSYAAQQRRLIAELDDLDAAMLEGRMAAQVNLRQKAA